MRFFILTRSIMLFVFVFSKCYVFSSTPNYVPLDGLLGWYSFSSNANNNYSSLYNGIVNGASLTSDRFGNSNSAYLFDGIDDFINLGSVILTGSSNATVSCWINSTNKIKAQNVFNKRRQGNGDGLNITIFNEKIYGVLNREPDIFENPAFTPPKQFTDNDWVHLVITNVNGAINLYKNGILISQINLQQGAMVGSMPFYIGKGFDSEPDPNGTRAFVGKIDDVGIWDRALCNTEILNLYNSSINLPIISNDTTIACGNSFVIKSNSGYASYSWLPAIGLSNANIQNPTCTATQSTTYILTATTTSGCIERDTLNVYVTPATLTTQREETICAGDSVPLKVTGATSYHWQKDISLSDTSVAQPFAKPLSTQVYYLTANKNGCIITDSVTVKVVKLTVAITHADKLICQGDSTFLAASSPNQVNWSPKSHIFNSSSLNPTVFPPQTTVYYVKADSAGCHAIDSVTVLVNPAVGVLQIRREEEICLGDSINLSVSGASSYHWYSHFLIHDTTAQKPLIKPLSTNLFKLIAYVNGCKIYDSVTVRVVSVLTTVTNNDTSICFGDTLQLVAVGGSKYSWYPALFLSDSTSASPLVNPSNTITYKVKGYSAHCVAEDSVTIIVEPMPEFDIADTTICINSSFVPVIKASKYVDSCFWKPITNLSSSIIQTPTIYANQSITYTTLVKNKIGCVSLDSFRIEVSDVDVGFEVENNPVLTPEVLRIKNQFIQSGYGYNWYMMDTFWTNDPEPSVVLTSSGTYKIKLVVINQYGCIDSATQTVEALSQQQINIPNCFTPNHDNINDFFEFTYDEHNTAYFICQIWNRWGQKIAEFDSKNKQWWNGTYQEKICPEGVYFYTINFQLKNAQTVQYHGTVSLFR